MKRSLVYDLSKEDYENLQKRILIEGMLIEMSALIDKLGTDGALEAVRPYVKMSAQAFIINMNELLRKEGTDVDKIAEATELWQILSGNATGVQEIDAGEDRIIRAGFLNCPAKSAPKEYCIFVHDMMLNGICEAINSEYHCRFTQRITEGDPICSYIIEKKKE